MTCIALCITEHSGVPAAQILALPSSLGAGYPSRAPAPPQHCSTTATLRAASEANVTSIRGTARVQRPRLWDTAAAEGPESECHPKKVVLVEALRQNRICKYRSYIVYMIVDGEKYWVKLCQRQILAVYECNDIGPALNPSVQTST